MRKRHRFAARALRALDRQRWRLRDRSGLLILMYHSVTARTEPSSYPYEITADAFERHLSVLDEFAEFVTPDAVLGPSTSPNSESLKILLTFDDGYRNNLDTALPILEAYDAPAVFFLPTGLLGGLETFLDWDGVERLVASDVATIGSHTHRHLNLTSLNDRDVRQELRESKRWLEDRLGREIDLVSYPSGGYDETVIQQVREAGYQVAFKDRFDANGNDDRYSVARLSVDQHNAAVPELLAELAVSPTLSRIGDSP